MGIKVGRVCGVFISLSVGVQLAERVAYFNSLSMGIKVGRVCCVFISLSVGIQLAECVAYLFLSLWGYSWQSVWRIYFSLRGDAIGTGCGVLIYSCQCQYHCCFFLSSFRTLFVLEKCKIERKWKFSYVCFNLNESPAA